MGLSNLFKRITRKITTIAIFNIRYHSTSLIVCTRHFELNIKQIKARAARLVIDIDERISFYDSRKDFSCASLV